MHNLQNLAPAGWTLVDAAAINAYAQITGTGYHNGSTEAYLLNLHPNWQRGNGSWSDASRWRYAGMGAFGFTPGLPHGVVISPSGSATLWGPVDATVNRLTVQTGGTQIVTLCG